MTYYVHFKNKDADRDVVLEFNTLEKAFLEKVALEQKENCKPVRILAEVKVKVELV